MKYLKLITLLLLSIYSFSQEKEVKTISQGAYKLTYISPSKVQLEGLVLSVEETKACLKNVPKSLEFYKKGRNIRTLGSILIVVGSGIIVGNTIKNLSIANQNNSEGDIINGNVKEGSPIPYFIGLAFVGTSIPILSSGKKSIRKSIDIYNSRYTGSKNISVNLITNQQGLGMALVF